jgi:hypothetical protein
MAERRGQSETTATLGEEVAYGAKQPALGDDDPRTVNLFTGLERVAAVGEKRGAAGLDDQEAGAAGKAAEIANVGGKGDQ